MLSPTKREILEKNELRKEVKLTVGCEVCIGRMGADTQEQLNNCL